MASSLFDGLRSVMRQIAGEPRVVRDDEPDELILAVAALLFHVIDADGVVTDDERARLIDVLVSDYGLSAGGEAERVAEAGRAANDEAVDLYHFTSILKNRLDEAARIRFVEELWEVTFADGQVHELEDNVIWRVSDLLGVSTRDRMLRKRAVAGRTAD